MTYKKKPWITPKPAEYLYRVLGCDPAFVFATTQPMRGTQIHCPLCLNYHRVGSITEFEFDQLTGAT